MLLKGDDAEKKLNYVPLLNTTAHWEMSEMADETNKW